MLYLADACCRIAIAALGASGQIAPDTTGLSEMIEAFVNVTDLRSVAVAVVVPGEVRFAATFGGDGAGGSLTADHTFQLGAVTEVLTATAILRLVEAGKIRLDAPVLDYLPSLRMSDPDRLSALTVRHLLTHTSGFSALSGFNRRLRVEGRAEFIEWSQDPGSGSDESVANFILLGQVLEAAGGATFSRVLREEVLGPMGMSRTDVSPTKGDDPSLVPGYGFTVGLQRRRSPHELEPFTIPAQGARSSLRDLASLLQRLVPAAPGQSTPGDASDTLSATSDWLSFRSAVLPGFGWRETSWEGHRAFHARGAMPGYSADLVILPDNGYGVVLLTNRTPGLIAPTSDALMSGILTVMAGGTPSAPNNAARWVSLTLGLLMLALILRTASLARSWRRLGRPRAVAHPPQIVLRLILDIAIAGGAPLVVVLVLLRMSFPNALAFYPDLGVALVVVPLVGGPAAVLRALVNSERWRSKRTPG